jgi:uncharacterized protein (DUF1778 family)
MSTSRKNEAIWLRIPSAMRDEITEAAKRAGIPRAQFIREASLTRARAEAYAAALEQSEKRETASGELTASEVDPVERIEHPHDTR